MRSAAAVSGASSVGGAAVARGARRAVPAHAASRMANPHA